MKAFMTALCAVCLMGVVAVCTAQDQKDKDPKDVKGIMEGRYTVVSGEEGGRALPEDRFKGGYFTFDKGKFGGYGADKKMTFGGDYKLDTSKTPWTITWKNAEGKEMSGIVQQQGDNLKIYYAMPGGTVPTGFDKTGEKQGSFTLRRDTTGGGVKDKAPDKDK